MSIVRGASTKESAQTQQILRFTRTVTLLTLLSRLFGYVRDLAIAILLGTSLAADAFVIAFRLPNLLRRLMADGAMTSAFIPVFTSYRVERPESDAWEFARRMFWALAVVLFGFTLLGVFFAPELVRFFTLASDDPEKWSVAVLLTRITFPYCLLISLTALAGGILNTLRVFGLPASVPIFLNLAIIGAAVVAWWLELAQPAVALALGVALGGLLQFLVQLPALVRRGMRFKFKLDFSHPGIRRVGKLMVPAIFGVGIYQVNVLVSTIFASEGEGWISALYYADRLMELVLGAYAISVATVVLPVMSQQAAEKKFTELRETLTFSFRSVAFIVVPAAVGLIVLREPIVRTLFEHEAFGANSTALTASALLFYALGLPAFSSVRVMIQGFYATQDTATPVRVAALALIANVVLCFSLVGPLKHGGLALATSLASYVNFVVLYAVFRRRLGGVNESRLGLSVGRSLAAAAVMGMACHWLATQLGLLGNPRFAVLAAGLALTIAVGVIIYLSLAWLLGSEELSEVYTLVTGRRLREEGPDNR